MTVDDSAQRQHRLLVVDDREVVRQGLVSMLSRKTVKNYVSSILSKLNLQRRAQAAAYVAKRHGGA